MEVLTLKQREDGVYALPTDALMAAVDERIKSSALAPLAQDGKAELEASASGVFQKIIDFKPGGVPVGAGIVGGTTAFLLTELSDYIIAKTAKTNPDGTKTNIVPTWAADALMALGAVLVGKKWKMVAPAANLAAMFLIYEAVRSPLETQIDKILHPTTTAQPRSAVEQAEQVARNRQLGQDPATTGDYYRTAFRRA